MVSAEKISLRSYVLHVMFSSFSFKMTMFVSNILYYEL